MASHSGMTPQVLTIYRALRAGHATADEIAAITGIRPHNVRTRLSDLLAAGKVRYVGKIRPSPDRREGGKCVTIWGRVDVIERYRESC